LEYASKAAHSPPCSPLLTAAQLAFDVECALFLFGTHLREDGSQARHGKLTDCLAYYDEKAASVN